MAWGTWRGWPAASGGGGLVPGDLPQYMPQWIPAGAWEPDPANTQNALVKKPFGTSPGGTYAIYPTINFPQISQDAAQYWYFTTAPVLNWSTNQVKFRVHFIVDQTISPPGAYRFTLNARRLTDLAAPSGAKTGVNLDYTLGDAIIPRYRITSLSGALTITSAVSNEALLLELTRGTATNDESDSAYVVGMELHFV